MTKKELMDFICEILGIERCNALILSQINKNVTEREYTYKDIARALCYYVDVLGRPMDPKYGIGIVPIIMDDARAYFEQERRKQEEQRRAAQLQTTTTVMHVAPLSTQKSIRKRHIDISQL